MNINAKVKEVFAEIENRAKAHLETLNFYEKRELADNYRKSERRNNIISIAVYLVFFAGLVTLANLLPELYNVEIAFVIPLAIASVIFLFIAGYCRIQLTRIGKMGDEEAALKGAMKLVEKSLNINEILNKLNGVVTNTPTAPAPTVAVERTNVIEPTTPASIIDDGVSGKETIGEGDKLEGEVAKQTLERERSVAELLSELKDLYEKGLITAEDYEKKKAEILAKM